MTTSMTKPCVIDIKIGKQTWDPLATPNKRCIEEEKYSLSKRELGFCVPGFQVYSLDSTKLLKCGKDFGKCLRSEQIQDILELFFNTTTGLSLPLLWEVLSKLYKIRHWFHSQRLLKFYASSILIAYDCQFLSTHRKKYLDMGDTSACVQQHDRRDILKNSYYKRQTNYRIAETSQKVRVKMIDFAHVFPVEDGSPDNNYLFGLQNLITIIEDMNFKISQENFFEIY